MSSYHVEITIMDVRSWEIEADSPEQARDAAMARYEADGRSGDLLDSEVIGNVAYDDAGHSFPDPELEDDDDDQ